MNRSIKSSWLGKIVGLPASLVAALLLPTAASALAGGHDPNESTRARVQEAFGNLPLSFEANQGQTDPQVRFLARGSGYSLFLTASEAVFQLRHADSRLRNEKGVAAPARGGLPRTAIPATPSAVLRMKLLGANSAPAVVGHDQLPGRSHYFIGNDPTQWRTDIAHYGKVKYQGVYPGVDLIYYGNQRQLEYDFVVSAGADPGAIKLSFAGAREVSLSQDGELVLKLGDGEVRQRKPVIYQEVAGVRKQIAGGYRLEAQGQVSFQVGRYDASRELVIDPVLVYSSYLGGSGLDFGADIAVDAAGHAHITGRTASTDFPTNVEDVQPANAGASDAFVTKLNRLGTALIYSTYLGGSGAEGSTGIAVDEAGFAYVTGQTDSDDFPITPGAFQTAKLGASDAFVTKLNRQGSALNYSTYLGGTGTGPADATDGGNAIAVDNDGFAYVTGHTDSSDFPITPGAFQMAYAGGDSDAFVTKLHRSGRRLVYSTYLGGSGTDFGPFNGIAVDQDDFAYVVVSSDSLDLPTTANAFQAANANAGFWDPLVLKLNRPGSALVYATYLGGTADEFGGGIAVDDAGHAYVTGWTESLDFPTTVGAFQPAHGGSFSDGFVTKLHRRGTGLIFSTYLGGSGSVDGWGEYGTDIGLDSARNVYVTGQTDSADFPITPDAFQTANAGGTSDAFVTKLHRSGATLMFSTYLGGSGDDVGMGLAVDDNGDAYAAGYTSSFDLPTTSGAFQSVNGGGAYDAFVAKVRP